MTPETERAALLRVSGYVRRKAIDPYAAIRAETTERLRIAVAIERMEREIAEMVRVELERTE